MSKIWAWNNSRWVLVPIATAMIMGFCFRMDQDADIYSVATRAPVIIKTGVLGWADIKHKKLKFTDKTGTIRIFCNVYYECQYCLPNSGQLPAEMSIGVINFKGRSIIFQARDDIGNEIINRSVALSHFKADSQDVKRLTFWHMAPIGFGLGFAIAAVFEPRPRRRKSNERLS